MADKNRVTQFLEEVSVKLSVGWGYVKNEAFYVRMDLLRTLKAIARRAQMVRVEGPVHTLPEYLLSAAPQSSLSSNRVDTSQGGNNEASW